MEVSKMRLESVMISKRYSYEEGTAPFKCIIKAENSSGKIEISLTDISCEKILELVVDELIQPINEGAVLMNNTIKVMKDAREERERQEAANAMVDATEGDTP